MDQGNKRVIKASRQTERRHAPRFGCDTRLEMEWGSALLHGRIRDVSASGMFIEVSDPLWVGAGFRARLFLEEPVQVDCFVRRVEPGCGMGVSVDLPENGLRERYLGFVQALSRQRP
ncbi:MAG: PilZ domain-containing protein [Acidobacteriia bacterium]|nr:PilZ domain-containing protein [Terriglobia bacterium]